MKLFRCEHCAQLLYFDNHSCERCRHRLGYLPKLNQLVTLEPDGAAAWHAVASPGSSYRFCANAAHGACNWLVPAGTSEPYCLACRHNGIVPDLSVSEHLAAWRKMEAAKHALFYTLLRLGLPIATRTEDPEHGLVFEFLADPPSEAGDPRVMTGHDNGTITIALIEADDAERERRRTAMGEPYRTLLGHFRHEVGHHYWDLLVRDAGEERLAACRTVFGDDRQDYGEALRRHHTEGPLSGWQEHHISAYATAHPWEDWAETWAHYLHIVDTLEMARAFGLHVSPEVAATPDLDAQVNLDPYQTANMQALLDAWLPLTFALNSLNRCMGQPDLYPFFLSPAVIAKLGFIHAVVRASRA